MGKDNKNKGCCEEDGCCATCCAGCFPKLCRELCPCCKCCACCIPKKKPLLKAQPADTRVAVPLPEPLPFHAMVDLETTTRMIKHQGYPIETVKLSRSPAKQGIRNPNLTVPLNRPAEIMPTLSMPEMTMPQMGMPMNNFPSNNFPTLPANNFPTNNFPNMGNMGGFPSNNFPTNNFPNMGNMGNMGGFPSNGFPSNGFPNNGQFSF